MTNTTDKIIRHTDPADPLHLDSGLTDRVFNALAQSALESAKPPAQQPARILTWTHDTEFMKELSAWVSSVQDSTRDLLFFPRHGSAPLISLAEAGDEFIKALTLPPTIGNVDPDILKKHAKADLSTLQEAILEHHAVEGLLALQEWDLALDQLGDENPHAISDDLLRLHMAAFEAFESLSNHLGSRQEEWQSLRAACDVTREEIKFNQRLYAHDIKYELA